MRGIEAFDPCQAILVVAAHADDLETMCGGTLVQLLAQGKRVDLLLATDGDLGTSDPSLERPTLAALRRVEARRAGEALGLRHVRFLGYHDGELVNDLKLREEVAYAYRLLQPDTVFTFDPLAAYRANLHSDHIAVARAAIDAFMPAKMGLYHPQHLSDGIQLSRVKHIFCFLTAEPDVVVPVDAVYQQKLAASMIHKSQFPKGEESLEWMKARDRAMAERHAGEGTEYAEGFRSLATY
jgi:LmbE family N-acetylglucosaminyl deacetylase